MAGTYDDFKEQLTTSVKPLFDSLRDYCFSLGENVVEDVNINDVCFHTTTNPDNFACFIPQKDSIEVNIQTYTWSGMFEISSVESYSGIIHTVVNLEELKKILRDAYNAIHEHKLSQE